MALFQDVRLDEAISEIETAIAAVDLSGVLGTTTATNASAETAYRQLDRMDHWPHLGVVVTVPSSRDTGRTDARDRVWTEDTVVVELRVDLSRVSGQRVLLEVATAHEQRLRAAVLGCDQRFRPSWRDTARTVLDGRWLSLRLVFTVERLELAGVAA